MRTQSMQNNSAVIVEVHSHLSSLEFLRYLYVQLNRKLQNNEHNWYRLYKMSISQNLRDKHIEINAVSDSNIHDINMLKIVNYSLLISNTKHCIYNLNNNTPIYLFY